MNEMNTMIIKRMIAKDATMHLLQKQAALQLNKKAGVSDEIKAAYNSAKDWASANDWQNAKSVATGLGAAGLTYGLTGLLPNAKKQRVLRLLSSIAAGGAAGAGMHYYQESLKPLDELGFYNKLTGNNLTADEAANSRSYASEVANPDFQQIYSLYKARKDGSAPDMNQVLNSRLYNGGNGLENNPYFGRLQELYGTK